MKPFYLLLVGVFTLTACSSEAPSETAQAVRDITYFSEGWVIPGDGSAPIDDVAFVVGNGRITELGPRSEVPPPKGAVRVNLGGGTVVPFLANLHGHVGLLKGMDFNWGCPVSC